ncbi:MAG: hypothetical protein M6G77_01245 [Candidatus Phytoplasma vitis]|nr:MAG: hypothetical protein M6G77_01090 [Candidatus Phytoplasma vitis]USQ93598.1 MAG: hypothetical protein M6G77_01245 [Candidatus Phytoplasma vitis]
MNKFKQSVLEIESCYFDLFFNLFKKLDIFLLENKEINNEKIKEEINKLIKRIKNLLFYKVVNFKFPFPSEKMEEDLLLTTYQLLVKKNKKIQSEIQNFGEQDSINGFIVKLIKNHFFDLLRVRNRHEIRFVDVKNSIFTKSNQEVELSNFDVLDNLIIHNTNETKFGDEYYHRECEINLLNNIVNRELTKQQLKIFQTIYQLKNNFKEIKQFNILSNIEVAKKLKTTTFFIANEKTTIHKKIKSAKKRRRLVDLLNIAKITNKNFLQTLKCYQIEEHQPQKTYYLDYENILYYSKFDEKLIFKLIENQNNQYQLTKLYLDEINYIEQEKKLK